MMPLLLAKYYILLVVISLGVYYMGHVFLTKIAGIAEDGIETGRIFRRLIIGICILVVGYAIFCTRGFTVMWGMVIIAALWKWELKIKKTQTSFVSASNWRISPRYLLELLIVVSLYVSWQAFDCISLSEDIALPCHADIHHAGRNIDALNLTGIERVTISDTDPQQVLSAHNPYHYFEYWFIGLLARCTGNLPIFVLKWIQVPLFLLTIYVGISYLLELYTKKIPYFYKLLLLLFPFFHPNLFGANIPSYFLVSYVTDWLYLSSEPLLFKTLPLYLFTVSFLIFLQKRNWAGAILSLSVFPIICTTTSPIMGISLIGSLGIMYILLFILQRVEKLQRWIDIPDSIPTYQADIRRYGLYVLIPFLFVFIFYKIPSSFPPLYEPAKNLQFGNILAYYNHSQAILDLLYQMFVKIPIDILCTWSIGIGLGLIYLYTHRRISIMAIWGIIFFVLSGYFSSLFSILFSFAYGHYVFLRITNLPFVNLVLFASILYFILNINKYKYIALGLGVIVLGKLSYQCGKELQLRQETHAYYANKRDLLYYKKIIAASDTLGQRGVFMLSERKLDDSNIGEEYDISYLQTDYWERLNPSVFYLGQILNYYKPHVTVSVLSETPYYEPATASNSNPQDFAPYQYYSIYKRTHAFPDSTRESAKQVSFIRDIGASFMFASKWADVPPEILYLVKDSAIDRISGERFYIFNTLPHQ